MTRGLITNAVLVTGIALTWGVGATLVIEGMLGTPERSRMRGEAAMEEALRTERIRLDAAVERVEQDLREEAAYIAEHDSLALMVCIARWLPLLSSDRMITSIDLADESGEVFRLERAGARWRATISADAEDGGQSIVSEWSIGSDPRAASPRIAGALADPRSSAWFGQALEDKSSEPTWSMVNAGDSARLAVALLVRAPTKNAPYHILQFELYATDLVRSAASAAPSFTTVHLGSDGRPLYVSGTDTTLLVRMLASWSLDKKTTPFVLEQGDTRRIARVVPHAVNGSQFYIAVLVPLDDSDAASISEKRALWTGAASTLLLGAFLLTAWFVRGRAAKRSERQERKRRTQEQRLGKALGERQILEREVHHRVKNNLQVVGSLLSLQYDRVNDPMAKEEFLRGKRRIDQMALVHHRLYAQPDLRAIDLQVFLSQVAASMKAMHEPHSRTVGHSVDASAVRADADTSIQVGIILCELMTNCYQHAFPYITGGHIEIIVRPDASDLYRLTVQDNGKGITRDPAHREQELGLELVEALAEQIDGGMEVIGGEGTRVEVTFRMQGQARVLNL